MIKLLLVEDDENLRYVIKGSLEDMIGGYEVLTAGNGKEGLAMWKDHKFDIIIADIEMPEMDGFEMVGKIRETDTNTLIFFASAHKDSKNVTAGFELGAHNFVKKPFLPNELDAYIKAMLNVKKGLQRRNESQIKKIGNYTFDLITWTLKDKNGDSIHLTPTEAGIICTLLMHKGETVKRETLLEEFWNTKDKDFYASRSFDVFLSGLRKKLIDESVKIETVRGIGVRLVC